MPNRIIRDGINTSARVRMLSGGAELFYRRLMTVVDDYGRYHGHPTTLRAAAWPTDPDKATDVEVEQWLAELSGGDKPLVRLYVVEGARYVELDNFGQRQRSQSKFPNPAKTPRAQTHTQPPDNPRATRGQVAADCAQPADNPPTTGGEKSALGEGVMRYALCERGDEHPQTQEIPPCGNSGNVENAAPSTPLANPDENARKTPTRARSATATPSSAEIAAGLKIPDGLSPADVAVVRESLDKLAPLVKLPRPDDGIVTRIIAVCRGAPGEAIHQELRRLYNEGKFRGVRSWGFLPLVLNDRFQDYVRQQTA